MLARLLSTRPPCASVRVGLVGALRSCGSMRTLRALPHPTPLSPRPRHLTSRAADDETHQHSNQHSPESDQHSAESDQDADLARGLELLDRGSLADAVDAFAAAASRGDATSNFFLGLAYDGLIGRTADGGHPIELDAAAAARCYGRAAESGHAQAMLNLSLCHKHGEGVPSPDVRAFGHLVNASVYISPHDVFVFFGRVPRVVRYIKTRVVTEVAILPICHPPFFLYILYLTILRCRSLGSGCGALRTQVSPPF